MDQKELEQKIRGLLAQLDRSFGRYCWIDDKCDVLPSLVWTGVTFVAAASVGLGLWRFNVRWWWCLAAYLIVTAITLSVNCAIGLAAISRAARQFEGMFPAHSAERPLAMRFLAGIESPSGLEQKLMNAIGLAQGVPSGIPSMTGQSNRPPSVRADRNASSVTARIIKTFDAACYPYEKLADFYAWEEAIRKGTTRSKLDVEAVQRLVPALDAYEESIGAIARHLNRSVFVDDTVIIQSLRANVRGPVVKAWTEINAFLNSGAFAASGGLRAQLTEREILDTSVQEMLNRIVGLYFRISCLLVWREALAIPPHLAAMVPQATFLITDVDLAQEIRSQMKSITSDSSLLAIRGERLILRVAMQNYLGHAFLELLKNSVCAAERSGRRADIVVDLSHRGNDGFATISDEAGGVQAENFERMFCVGCSMSGAGNGLGWSIISRNINRHGGAVEVENVPGVGIRTKLTLPGAFEGGKL